MKRIVCLSIALILVFTNLNLGINYAATPSITSTLSMSDSFFYSTSPSLTGFINSSNPINMVDVSIKNSSNTIVFGACWYTTVKSFDISNIKSQIPFTTLIPGNYTLIIKATDSQKYTKTVFTKPFIVHPNNKQFTASQINLALKATVQNIYPKGSLERTACATFALAYCRSILDNTKTYYKNYWSSPTNESCAWYKGNYTTLALANQSEVLKKAFYEFNFGRPSVLYVISNTIPQHWVTVIGYTNVKNPNSLTLYNIVILDPLDGKIYVLGDKYKLHSTLKIAIEQSDI